MGFENVNLLTRYKTNKNQIVKEFYLPVLKESVIYKRSVGFFTSTALIELSRGLSGLINNGGRIRLIVSPLLDKEDIEAISLLKPMKRKRIYVSPTIEVVEMVSGSKLLDTSTSTTRQGYTYEENGWQ